MQWIKFDKNGKKKLFLYALLVLILLLVGYLLGSRNSIFSPVPSITKKLLEKSKKYKTTSFIEVPACSAGRCPTYYSMDVDDDDYSESVVVEPIGMSQGAGKVWVIDDDLDPDRKFPEVVFISEIYGHVSVRRLFNQQGFIISYGTEANAPANREIKYVYKDGDYVKEGEGGVGSYTCEEYADDIREESKELGLNGEQTSWLIGNCERPYFADQEDVIEGGDKELLVMTAGAGCGSCHAKTFYVFNEISALFDYGQNSLEYLGFQDGVIRFKYPDFSDGSPYCCPEKGFIEEFEYTGEPNYFEAVRKNEIDY